MEIIVIAAMARNSAIGKNNALPWSLKEDLARFKELTTGWPCIMGRNTWESLPKRPLPNRPNLVVSRSLAPETEPRAEVFPSLDAALRHCAQYQKVFICGGASLYREALAFADTLELTLIHRDCDGDVFFPEIDPARWTKTAVQDFDGFSFVTYKSRAY